MEKWAKVQNAQKESKQDGFKKPLAPPVSTSALQKSTSGAADVGFAVLAKVSSNMNSKLNEIVKNV